MTDYTLTLPFRRPPAALWGNTRAHWRRRSADTKQVRTVVAALAKQARIPACDHVTVELVWSPGDRRRRDADNLWPLLKCCCDALARGRRDWVGLELVPDDTPAYMEKKAPRILSPDECREIGMWLHVTTSQVSSPSECPENSRALPSGPAIGNESGAA